MDRKIVFAGLATLTLAASAAPAAAQGWIGAGFDHSGYSGRYGSRWSYSSYASGPLTCATPYRSARAALRGRNSGFYLVGSRYDTDDRAYASTGFGWQDSDWRRQKSRLPMH
jgi:hypothetical protein